MKNSSTSKNTLRVLHVIPSVSPLRGGPSKAIIEMVRALRASGIDADIATTNDHGPGKLDVSLYDQTSDRQKKPANYHGAQVYFFDRYSSPVNAIKEFAYSAGFKRWLKKNIDQYDVVHVHAIFSFCSSYAMYLARKKNIPYVVRPIGQLEIWSLQQSTTRKNAYLKLIERKNIESAAAVHFTAQSESQQAQKGLSILKPVVIPLGIHLPEPINNAKAAICKQYTLKHDIPTLLYLSRLHPKKGLEKLLSALEQLNETPFQLLIAGNGDASYMSALKKEVTTKKLEERCQFIGFINGEEKTQLLQGVDLFTLTSHSENFGIAVLEAMAAGTCVLVSNEVALSEKVKKHQLGYVTTLDSSDIANTLKVALSNQQLRLNMGVKARHFIEQEHQWSSIAARLISLYESAVN